MGSPSDKIDTDVRKNCDETAHMASTLACIKSVLACVVTVAYPHGDSMMTVSSLLPFGVILPYQVLLLISCTLSSNSPHFAWGGRPPLWPQRPKIVHKTRKHQQRKGSANLKFHPNTLQDDPKFHLNISQDPPKRPNIPSQYPLGPQHPKIVQKTRKHQQNRGSAYLKFHPNTLQHDPKLHLNISQDLPKRPNIPSQDSLKIQRPKTRPKITKTPAEGGLAAKILRAPPAKADIATAIWNNLTNVIEHLVWLFAPQ